MMQKKNIVISLVMIHFFLRLHALPENQSYTSQVFSFAEGKKIQNALEALCPGLVSNKEVAPEKKLFIVSAAGYVGWLAGGFVSLPGASVAGVVVSVHAVARAGFLHNNIPGSYFKVVGTLLHSVGDAVKWGAGVVSSCGND